MDTPSNPDEPFDLLEIVATSRASLPDTQKQLSKDVRKLCKEMTRRMYKEPPKVDQTATRQQLLTAAKT